MNNDEDPALLDALKRLLSALGPKASADPPPPERPPEHLLKRELERQLRENGFSKTQAAHATAIVFDVLRLAGQ